MNMHLIGKGGVINRTMQNIKIRPQVLKDHQQMLRSIFRYICFRCRLKI